MSVPTLLVAGQHSRLIGNKLSGSVQAITVTGSYNAIVGNYCGDGDIVTTAGSGYNTEVGNVEVGGTSAYHANDAQAGNT